MGEVVGPHGDEKENKLGRNKMSPFPYPCCLLRRKTSFFGGLGSGERSGMVRSYLGRSFGLDAGRRRRRLRSVKLGLGEGGELDCRFGQGACLLGGLVGTLRLLAGGVREGLRSLDGGHDVCPR